MKNFFEKRIVESSMLDFSNNFAEICIPVEIRRDRLINRVSRVMRFRLRGLEGFRNAGMIEKSKSSCPFCPDHIEKSTPKFCESLIPEGRIRFGEATVLPNAFPYSKYCGVTVFSKRHFIPLEDFSPEILFNALKASTIFIDRVHRQDDQVSHASINWNYMPVAGGGLVHPHLQAVVSPRPTHFQDRLIEASAAYRRSQNRNCWADLVALEKSEGERYLFQQDEVEFLSAFCPKGMIGEIVAVFTGKTGLKDLSDAVLNSFASGLARVIRGLKKFNVNSLNMSLLISLREEDELWIQARIIPRMALPPWGTSDVNYFEKGHDEVIVILPPEELALALRTTE